MSRTTDPGLFFQTESSLSEISRKSKKSANTEGSPIVLPSKILAIHEDRTDGNSVFVAESAATARRITLDSKTTPQVYRGPNAPLSSLAISPDNTKLFAGCWDKTIWSWEIASRTPLRQFVGHSDFVKALVCVRVKSSSTQQNQASFEDLLLSGGADALIIVWSIATGSKLHVLKGHTRGILGLAVQPLSSFDAIPRLVFVFSAGSDREIRRWRISAQEAVELTPEKPILVHETSVNKMYFAAAADTDSENVELWTASSDKTAKCLSWVQSIQFGKNDTYIGDWEEDTSLLHPDFVRDIVVDMQNDLVVTACRDENVRIWRKSSAELIHTFSGHFEEVTGLILVGDPRERRVLSVSIDGTIRQWDIGREGPRKAKANAGYLVTQDSNNTNATEERPTNRDTISNSLTEDEERELAELMEDDA